MFSGDVTILFLLLTISKTMQDYSADVLQQTSLYCYYQSKLVTLLDFLILQTLQNKLIYLHNYLILGHLRYICWLLFYTFLERYRRYFEFV